MIFQGRTPDAACGRLICFHSPPRSATLGALMTPRETGLSYDQIADIWNNARFNRQNGIRLHEHALTLLGRSGHAVDLGCGCNGRFIDLLLSRGFAVEGVDVSARMIELARARHPQVTFHHADACEWIFPRACDFITAWDSLWHAPLAAQEALTRRICDALAPGGVYIFTTGGTDRAEEKTDSCMGPAVGYATLGIPRTLALLDERGCVCRHLEYDQFPEKHLCIIAQKRS